MKYVVDQGKSDHGGRVRIARFARAADAIHFAGTLAIREPERWAQAWRVHKGRLEYCLFCETESRATGIQTVQDQVAKAIAKAREQEKDWLAKRAKAKARSEAILPFIRRFDLDLALMADEPFRAAFFADPPDLEKAECRALELGYRPRMDADGHRPPLQPEDADGHRPPLQPEMVKEAA